MNLNIIKKLENNIKENIKLKSSSEVVEIKDVQAIRNAYKEHLLFIGLDNGNNVRNISLLGVGSNCNILINTKDILQTALLTCSDKIILVHNHPSNSLEPSSADIHITNVTNQILETFNIQLLDHIIVTEKEFVSMEQIKRIDRKYTDDSWSKMTKGFLLEENQRLKQRVNELENKIQQEMGLKVISAQYVGNYDDTVVYNIEISLNGDSEYVTLERKSEDTESKEKWEVFSNLGLKDEEIDYIIQIISKNPPVMSIDALPKMYNTPNIEEIEMGE